KEFLGFDPHEVPAISAKEGLNIEEVLDMIIEKFPEPKGSKDAPLKALVFDSYYDAYKGIICLIGVKDGSIKKGDRIKMMQAGGEFTVTEVGFFKPNTVENNILESGDIGYFAASIKDVSLTKVGDTVTNAENGAKEPLPGYKEVMPVVFSGIFPQDGNRYLDLKDALDKLKLNDSSLSFTQETSAALGFGFRCGFLGLLHMEIISERLEREFGLDLITTAPSVSYKVYKTGGEVLEISNPSFFPKPTEIDYIEEPIARLNIYTPPEYVGALMELSQDKRGDYKDMIYMDKSRVKLVYDIPLGEIVFDFFDALKSRSKGYASLDYELNGYRKANVIKLDILLNGDICDALSTIVHKDKAHNKGASICAKLKEVISRQMFEVPIQAAIGSKIVARETVRANRKDVTAKCYGGDISRKRKLLEKQKEGKKKMRKLGSVELPSEAFIQVLKLD
ncbi:MAG: translation elongation factor 4, partial [Firmicutes bacterium]|nr:translation elongation factor 4 [Bacillota bacterium]